ncbi:hypothetical protein C8R44DRAFT_342686 [Mycena epipterygia]|nr:hypothetical protein C8R44DRAFT_342686 [Mycena epipterygia]
MVQPSMHPKAFAPARKGTVDCTDCQEHPGNRLFVVKRAIAYARSRKVWSQNAREAKCVDDAVTIGPGTVRGKLGNDPRLSVATSEAPLAMGAIVDTLAGIARRGLDGDGTTTGVEASVKSSQRLTPTARRPPGPAHTLTCGAEPVPKLLDPTHPKPWGSSLKCVVPFLSLPFSDRLSQFPKAKPSTGCGAEIYARESPRGVKTWNATAGAAGPTVAPLPVEYFTDEQKHH